MQQHFFPVFVLPKSPSLLLIIISIDSIENKFLLFFNSSDAILNLYSLTGIQQVSGIGSPYCSPFDFSLFPCGNFLCWVHLDLA